MRSLTLWESYSREDVHGIFSPDTAFTPQRGSWGVFGIVPLPDRAGDFVFFVTFGSRQGEHEFDESITADGALTWQSQPKQRLTDPQVRQFIAHEPSSNTIHLFLRARKNRPYTYCGRLGYLAHDDSRQEPVYFRWQLLDWPPPAGVLHAIDVHVHGTTTRNTDVLTGQLVETNPPAAGVRGGHAGLEKSQPIHPDRDACDAKLGHAGELLVLRTEADTLRQAGRSDLASRIVHVAAVDGDSAGYDIRSFTPDGTPRLIEVKTTRGPATTAFFVTPNQLKVSRTHPANYVLIRVYNYNDARDCGQCYKQIGPLDQHFELAASEFRTSLRR